MSKYNFKFWTKASAILALAGLVGTSNAASFEAADSQDVAGWAITVDANANLVGSNAGLINSNNPSADDWQAHLDKPVMAIKVQSPNGVITFEGVFDLELLSRRHINMNDDADKYSSLDGTAARHIIQELTAQYAASENLYIKAGLGTVNFMERERNLFATRPLQSNQEIRERLFAEVGYTLEDTGTTVIVSIFDGTEQRATDLMGSLSLEDFVDIPNLRERDSNSASFAGRLTQKLGDTGLEASVGFAHINNIDNAGNDQQRLSIGLRGEYEVADWVVSGLLQFVKTFDQVDMSSIVAEVSASNGKATAYLRGEIAEVVSGSSTEDIKRATLGVQYALVNTRNLAVSPFVELLIEDRDSYSESNLGLILGMKIAAGGTAHLPSRTE